MFAPSFRHNRAASLRLGLALCAAALLCLLSAATAHADAVIGTGTPASCTSNQASNDFTNAVIAGGTVSFNCGPNPVTIIVNTTVVDKPATVNGGGLVTLDGEDLRQHFFVQATGVLTLTDIVLIDGNAGNGGAIAVQPQGRVTMIRSFVISSSASSDGGAIHNRGTLTLIECNIGSNFAGINGGGIFNNGGTVVVQRSYLVSNQADSGGGIYSVNGALTVQQSAFRTNIVSGLGGAILNSTTNATFINSVFSDNRANQGGGLYAIASFGANNVTFNENRANQGGAIFRAISANPAALKNTILAGSLELNTNSPSLNCDGPTLTSQGRNIVSDNSCVPNPSATGDLLGTDPKLGIWQLLPIRSYIPAPDSPAVNYGVGCAAVDQLGTARPVGVACDVGSIERESKVFMPKISKP